MPGRSGQACQIALTGLLLFDWVPPSGRSVEGHNLVFSARIAAGHLPSQEELRDGEELDAAYWAELDDLIALAKPQQAARIRSAYDQLSRPRPQYLCDGRPVFEASPPH